MNAVAVEVLTKARSMVVRGWAQHQGYDYHTGSRCAGQALVDAFTEHYGSVKVHEHAEEYTEVVGYFVQVIGQPCIPMWNDATYRTKREVIAAFDKAITLAQGEVDTTGEVLAQAMSPTLTKGETKSVIMPMVVPVISAKVLPPDVPDTVPASWVQKVLVKIKV